MKSSEKILPNQKSNSIYYSLARENYENSILNLVEGLVDHRYPNYEHNDKSQAEMGSSIILQSILNFLIRSRKTKKILEIGTFMGMSAISMALNDCANKIDTIEKYESFAELAFKNIDAAGLTGKINVIVGDALQLLPDLKERYDLIFIDGDKENYDKYFENCISLLNQDGCIIVDDIFFHGDVFNEIPTTTRGAGVKRLISYLQEQKLKMCFTIIPISNGVLIAEFR